jgi:hypothetical protein
MVLSRQDAKVAFDHIIDHVLCGERSSNLKSALIREGYDDLFYLMMMDDDIINDLKYPDPCDSSELVPVKCGDKGLLKSWHSYVLHRHASGSTIGDDDWLKVTQEDFDTFRINPVNFVGDSLCVSKVLKIPTTLKPSPKVHKVASEDRKAGDQVVTEVDSASMGSGGIIIPIGSQSRETSDPIDTMKDIELLMTKVPMKESVKTEVSEQRSIKYASCGMCSEELFDEKKWFEWYIQYQHAYGSEYLEMIQVDAKDVQRYHFEQKGSDNFRRGIDYGRKW